MLLFLTKEWPVCERSLLHVQEGAARRSARRGEARRADFDRSIHLSDSEMAVALLSFHGAAVALAVALPFAFYTILWRRPQQWMRFCGNTVDPSHRMAQVSHALKALQILAVASVAANLSSLPPWHALVLFGAGQYLNFKTYELLGEAGVYYGAIFGKQLPWVEKFPFGYIRDPQYWGSILSLLGVSTWIPGKFLLLWILGYFYMMLLEREENPDSRSSKIS